MATLKVRKSRQLLKHLQGEAGNQMEQQLQNEPRPPLIDAGGLSTPLKKVVTGFVLFFAVCLAAVVGYVLMGWAIEDAIYMSVITIFGVGYGEVAPVDTPQLRALTIFVIVSGYGALIYTAGGFVQMLIDGEINKALGARKMTKEISTLRGHTIICGVGRMGSILARELYTAGKPFVVVDMDERRLQVSRDRGYLVLYGDATEEHVLEQAGIERAAALATVLSNDATNVFVTITARALNATVEIIARGENPRTEKKLIGCGANRVVLPTAIGAAKVAQLIIRPSAESMLEQIKEKSDVHNELADIGLQFDELEVTADSTLAEQRLCDIEVRSNHGFLIVGIRKADGSTQLNPDSETRLQAGDTVIVLGHNDDIPQLAAKFATTKRTITYRGVTQEL